MKWWNSVAVVGASLLAVSECAIRQHVAYTRPITLTQGGVSNDFHRLPIPKGPIAVYRFAADIVEILENGTVVPTPTYDAYLHHHVVGSEHKKYINQQRNWTPMKPKGVYHGVGFGAGTECRGTPQQFQFPYAFLTTEGEDEWIANVHVINIRGMSTKDAHHCLECPCTSEDVITENTVNNMSIPDVCNVMLKHEKNNACSAETYKGGLRCCEDGEYCLEKNQLTDVGPSTFYLRYTIDYDDVVPENRGLYLAGCCDASGDLNYHGNVEYDVPLCDPSINPGCVHTVSTVQRIGTGSTVFQLGQDNGTVSDQEVELVFAVGHQHRAGLGIFLYNDTTDELICSSIPEYGTGHEAGNEASYIHAMSTCTFDPPRRVKTSDIVRVVALYNSTEAHTGVMSLWYLAVADYVEGSNTISNRAVQSSGTSSTTIIIIGVVVLVALFGAGLVYKKVKKDRQGYTSLSPTSKH